MSDLKSCPFCGELPELNMYNLSGISGTTEKYTYSCSNCGLLMVEWDKEKLIKAWNRRVENKTIKKTTRFTPDISFIENDEWKSLYREWVENKKSPFKKQIGVKKGFSGLWDISGGDLATAQKIVDKSLANNWSGLFELKGTDAPVKHVETKTETPEEMYNRMAEEANR